MPNDYFRSLKSVFGLAAKCDAWETDRENFFKAVRRDDLETVTVIAKKYPGECLKWKNKKGSPLTVAQGSGSLKTFRFLLEQGADPNEDLGKGWTLLHYAVKNGRHDFAAALIDHRANLNARSYIKSKEVFWETHEFHDTPLTFAIKRNDKKMLHMLLERGADAALSPGPHDLAPVELAAKRGKYVLADLCKRAHILRQAYQEAERAARNAQAEAQKQARENGMQDVKIELRISSPQKGR
jgi:ankyrin repeat protein